MTTPAAKGPLDHRKEAAYKNGSNNVFEFVLCPNVGFLAGPEPLIKDAELKISFDRADPATALVKIDKTGVVPKYLEIKKLQRVG